MCERLRGYRFNRGCRLSADSISSPARRPRPHAEISRAGDGRRAMSGTTRRVTKSPVQPGPCPEVGRVRNRPGCNENQGVNLSSGAGLYARGLAEVAELRDGTGFVLEFRTTRDSRVWQAHWPRATASVGCLVTGFSLGRPPWAFDS